MTSLPLNPIPGHLKLSFLIPPHNAPTAHLCWASILAWICLTCWPVDACKLKSDRMVFIERVSTPSCPQSNEMLPFGMRSMNVLCRKCDSSSWLLSRSNDSNSCTMELLPGADGVLWNIDLRLICSSNILVSQASMASCFCSLAGRSVLKMGTSRLLIWLMRNFVRFVDTGQGAFDSSLPASASDENFLKIFENGCLRWSSTSWLFAAVFVPLLRSSILLLFTSVLTLCTSTSSPFVDSTAIATDVVCVVSRFCVFMSCSVRWPGDWIPCSAASPPFVCGSACAVISNKWLVIFVISSKKYIRSALNGDRKQLSIDLWRSNACK